MSAARKFHFGDLFSAVAHGLSSAVRTVGNGIVTAAKAFGSGVEMAAKDVGKGAEDVAEAGGKALVNAAGHVVNAVKDLGDGDVPGAVNQGLGATGLPNLPTDVDGIPTLPDGTPNWPALILAGEQGGLKPCTVPLSLYLDQVARRYALLGLPFGPEQAAAARAGAMAFPWIDPSR